jgi:hypothetical protein
VVPQDANLKNLLIRDLNAIHKLSGPFKVGEGVSEWEDDWAYRTNEVLKKLDTHFASVKAMDNFYSRKSSMLWRVAMCVCASRGDGMTITPEDLQWADDELSVIEHKIDKMFKGMGKNPLAPMQEDMLKYIKNEPMITRKDLWKKMMKDMSEGEFDEGLRALSASGDVEINRGDRGIQFKVLH